MRSSRFLIGLVAAAVIAVSARGSGILVPNDRNLPPLRITDHLVDVEIHNQVAITTLTQTFRNDSNQRLEATYVFPLPEEADLTNFRMTFNGKMVEGEVLPAEEARQIYESIVRQSRDPGLIEFIGRRLLQMRIFPIEPESDTTIELSYQQVLRPISGMRGYHYPLRTRKTSGHAYGTVRFNVELESEQAIKNIWSPTHSVETVRDGEFKATIAYEAQGGSLEEDFILLYSTDDADLGLSVIANRAGDNDTGHFLVLLSPKHLWPDSEYQPQDVVFVLDTSGSMSAGKIEQAREALKYSIDQLDERDRFSVVRFSTGFDVLFDDVQEATADNRRQAKEFIDRFKAAGGTNISDTLNHVASMQPADAGRPFVVVFMTDGRGNRDAEEILESFQKAVGETGRLRLFPFGVGHDVNTKLLDRLANDYTGRPTYVTPGENLELVLGDFFATISQPVLTNLKLEIPNIGVTDRFPVTLGDLYAGQQLTIAGKFDREMRGDVTLTAMRNGEDVTYTWDDVAFDSTDGAEYVAPIWAGRKIAWMIDEMRRSGENDEMINEVIALSKEYGIQTPYSSWLVAPERRPGMMPATETEILARGGRLREDLFRDAAPTLDLDRPLQGGGLGGGGGGFGGGGGGGNIFDDGGGPPQRRSRGLEGLDLSGAVDEESGEAATTVARVQESLRHLESRDANRLEREHIALRKIGEQTYHWVGPFLVDGRVDSDWKITYVLFGSEAYFDLVMGRKDLRGAFAAARNVIVRVGERQAVAIVDRVPEEEGDAEPEIEVIEQFSDQQREQMGLTGSK